MTSNNQIILDELNQLKSEAQSAPQRAVANLLNIGQNDDGLGVDESLMDSSIYGRIDYMLTLKHRCIDNLNEHYYYYAVLEAQTLDKLDSMNIDYIYVDENGIVASVTADNVIEAIDNSVSKID